VQKVFLREYIVSFFEWLGSVMGVTKSVFRTCVIFTIILLSVGLPFCAASPISNIQEQTVQGYRISPPYGWDYAYGIGFTNYELNVELGIRLTGASPGAALLSTWENGIENMWSRKFDIIDTTDSLSVNPYHYHVNFDVVFPTDPLVSVDQTVTVVAGTGRGNMVTWYTTTEWGSAYNGAYVAHEVGHMFSLYDEYSGGAVDPANPIIDNGSIMGSLAASAKSRHYEPFLDWLEQVAPGRDLSIGEYDPTWTIPEPSTLLLLGLGLLITRHKKSAKSKLA